MPASYVVVRRGLIAPERPPAYAAFLEEATRAGRPRHVCRARNGDDLYAVTQTEPAAELSGGCWPGGAP